jgi:hypothetical protein
MSSIPPDAPPDAAGRLLAEQTPGDNAPALTVSELSGALKRSVEDAFSHVRVRGEISGFKRVASGHCYLTLKDDRACIDGVIWKGRARLRVRSNSPSAASARRRWSSSAISAPWPASSSRSMMI